MSFSNVDWTLAGAVVITGLVVVFFMLALLWVFVILIGKIAPMISKKPQEQKSSPAVAPIQATVRPKLNSEIVAAITGAVSTTTNRNFKIKSISLKGDNTPLWTIDN